MKKNSFTIKLFLTTLLLQISFSQTFIHTWLSELNKVVDQDKIDESGWHYSNGQVPSYMKFHTVDLVQSYDPDFDQYEITKNYNVNRGHFEIEYNIYMYGLNQLEEDDKIYLIIDGNIIETIGYIKQNQYGSKSIKAKFPHNSTSLTVTLKHEISSKEEKFLFLIIFNQNRQIGFRDIRISLLRDCHAACHTCNFQSKYDCFDCNPGYYYTKYSSNAPTGLCNSCKEAINYCEDCISKTECLKCEGNLTLSNGKCGCKKRYKLDNDEKGDKICIYDETQDPFRARQQSRLLKKLLIPLKKCQYPQCYFYDTEDCATTTYKGSAELRKTQNPEVIHLIVKKNDANYPHSILSDGIVNQKAIITLIGIDNSNFTYTWHEITGEEDKKDLWVHELKFYYKVAITNNPILLIEWQNATYKWDDEFETQIDLCQLEFDKPNSSIILYNYYDTSKRYKRLMQQQADTSQVASGLVYILALLSAIDNGGQCFRTITAMQMTYMLKFVNMTLPPNVEYQLKEENELIDFSMFSLDVKYKDIIKLKERFYEWKISPFMLNNDGEVIFCLIMLFIGSWLFYLFNYLVEKSNSLELIDKQELTGGEKFKNFCKKSWTNAKGLILWRFVTCVYLMATVQISLYSWSNLVFCTFSTSSAGCFNFFMALFFKMAQFAIYIFLYKILDQSRGIKNLDILEDSNSEQIKSLKLQYEEEVGLKKRSQIYPTMDDQDAPLAALPQQQPQQAQNACTKVIRNPLSLLKMMRFQFLFREYKANQRLYPLADILRYEIICFVVCVFYQHATLQITCIGILSVLYLLDILTNKPFIEKLKHATAMFNEVMIAQSICLLYYLRQVEEVKQSERLSVGKFIIMSSQFQRVGNSIALIAIILQTIYYHYYNIKRDLKEEVIPVNTVKKDEDRLHLIESNINWLVQKFSRSFDQTLATIERVKGRMESGQLLNKDENTDNDNLTGETPQDMAKFTTNQLQQTTQFGQKTQQETNEEMLLDPKARKQNIGMKPSQLQFSVRNLAPKTDNKKA